MSEIQISDVAAYMRQVGERARRASRLLARAETAAKNGALLAIAEDLGACRADLMAANRQDLEAGAAQGLDAA